MSFAEAYEEAKREEPVKSTKGKTNGKTNGDTIREMNNMQLASWIMGVTTLHDYRSLLDWLSKEVGE